jgi:hypothetical protein
MLIGFQDDPGFRWSPDRRTMLADAARAHATIVRATANWWQIAAVRPVDAADSFDPAYHFDDLDDLIRSVAMDGMTVMLTIWGTPAWANEAGGPNYPPDHVRDLHAFARAIADRYSGRHPGFPFVGYYTIWNEPNSRRFLAPAFDVSGNPVSTRAQDSRLGARGARGCRREGRRLDLRVFGSPLDRRLVTGDPDRRRRIRGLPASDPAGPAGRPLHGLPARHQRHPRQPYLPDGHGHRAAAIRPT